MKDSPAELPPELQAADRRGLDDAVLELIGIHDADDRARVRDQLYLEIVLFYRQVRLLELQAIENKKRAKKGRTASAGEVAQEIFGALESAQLRRFPDDFLSNGPLETVELPEGKAKLFDVHDFYDASALAVGKTKINLRHRAQAELAKLYIDIHHVGFVKLPVSQQECERIRNDWDHYSSEMQSVFLELASERTDDEDRQEAIITELNRLLLHK